MLAIKCVFNMPYQSERVNVWHFWRGKNGKHRQINSPIEWDLIQKQIIAMLTRMWCCDANRCDRCKMERFSVWAHDSIVTKNCVNFIYRFNEHNVCLIVAMTNSNDIVGCLTTTYISLGYWHAFYRCFQVDLGSTWIGITYRPYWA